MCDEFVSRLNCLPRAIGWTTRRSVARVVPTEFDFRSGTQTRDSGRRRAVRLCRSTHTCKATMAKALGAAAAETLKEDLAAHVARHVVRDWARRCGTLRLGY